MADIIIDSDSGKFKAGGDQDLEVYNDGSHSYIKNTVNDQTIVLSTTTGDSTTAAVTVYGSNDVTIAGDLTVNGNQIFTASDVTDQLLITNTDAGTATGPDLVLYRNSSSPADNDYIGQILLRGKNDADPSEDVSYVEIDGVITDATDGNEDGSLYMFTMAAGSQVNTLALASGKVGIGTGAPANLLELEFANAVDSYTAANIESNDVSGIVINNTNTVTGHGGMLKFTSNDGGNMTAITHTQEAATSASLRFFTETSGTLAERMKIDHDGAISMSSTLAVSGNVNITSSSNVYLSIDTTQSNGDEWQILNAVSGTTSGLQFKDIDTSKLVMLLQEDGKIGVGTATPYQRMTLESPNNENCYIQFCTNDEASSATSQGLLVGLQDFDGSTGGNCYMWSQREEADIIFGTTPASGSPTTRMTIKDSGQVQIGVSSSDSMLRIRQDSTQTAPNNASTALTLSGYSSATQFGGGIGWTWNDAGASIEPACWFGTVAESYSGHTQAALVLATRNTTNNTAPTERMRISGAGDVTLPDESQYLFLGGTKLSGEHNTNNRRLQFHGSGDNKMEIGCEDDNGWGYITSQENSNGMYLNVNAGAFNFDTGHIRPYTDNEISLGEGNARFVNCHLINNPSVTSDERRKDNIKTSSLGLEFLNKLNPVQYKWKDYETFKKAPAGSEKEFTDEVVKHTYKRTHYGLIAQEVEKIITDSGMTTDDFAPLVYNKEGDTYGMMYGEYVGILIKAVQELSAEVEKLKENA